MRIHKKNWNKEKAFAYNLYHNFIYVSHLKFTINTIIKIIGTKMKTKQ